MNIGSTIKPLDQYENALVQYLKRETKPTLQGLREIWGWRCAIEAYSVDLPFLACAMWELVQRFGLMGHARSSLPFRGALGLIADAAPDREWTYHLRVDRGPLDDETRVYWYRVIAALASRLYLSEVKKLVGYNHDAVEGPFAALMLEKVEH